MWNYRSGGIEIQSRQIRCRWSYGTQTMINIVLAMFVFLCLTSILGIFLHVVNMKGVPQIVYDVYCYGKGCEGKLFSTWVTAVLVPKRYTNHLSYTSTYFFCILIIISFSSWFFHFYAFATLYTSMSLIVIVWMFLTDNQPPMVINMYISSLSAISHNTEGKTDKNKNLRLLMHY